MSPWQSGRTYYEWKEGKAKRKRRDEWTEITALAEKVNWSAKSQDM